MEIRKSIKDILRERISSPFYGALIISWLIWNWKIIYLTIFISEKNIQGTKIEYIVSNYSDVYYLIIYPILSTILLLTIFPLLTNGAYWLSLKFTKWRIDQKNIIEKKQLLTLEQSILIRKEIRLKEIEIQNDLDKKNSEIEDLNSENEMLKKSLIESENSIKKRNQVKFSSEYLELKKSKRAFEYLEDIVISIRKTSDIDPNIPDEIIEYYKINFLIELNYDETGAESYYSLTANGNKVYREYFNEKFDQKGTGGIKYNY